jgi:hypothetical protein
MRPQNDPVDGGVDEAQRVTGFLASQGVMTTATRQVSERNLHGRLAGPDDELKDLGDTINALLGRLEGEAGTQSRHLIAARRRNSGAHRAQSPCPRYAGRTAAGPAVASLVVLVR